MTGGGLRGEGKGREGSGVGVDFGFFDGEGFLGECVLGTNKSTELLCVGNVNAL